jgi:hypothetical protein
LDTFKKPLTQQLNPENNSNIEKKIITNLLTTPDDPPLQELSEISPEPQILTEPQVQPELQIQTPIDILSPEAVKSSNTLPKDHQTGASQTSNSGENKILETMLRIEVSYPKQRFMNLMDEYEDYLESNGLIDIKDVKRRNNIQKSNDDEVKSAEEANDIDIKFDPNDVKQIPISNKNLGYYDVLKGMITRMELEGTLGKRREYGRTVKGGKINEERDQEFFYNLDDEFIDDNEIVNNESKHIDFSQQELAESDIENYEFLPSEQLQQLGDNIQARKRKRMEDEQISDVKIDEKMGQLEKAFKENKDGAINILLQEVALKIKGNFESKGMLYIS